MRKIILSVMLIFCAFGFVKAQDAVETTVSADVVSRYVWRGAELDKSAIQPTLGIAYKGLSFSAWGSYGIQGDNDAMSEIDLTLAYQLGNFNIGITDYWSDKGDEPRYFKYGSNDAMTNHTFEANIGYDFGMCNLQWYTNIAGVDGCTAKGKRAYTSYVELAAPFKLGGVDFDAAIGAVPFSANTGYYEDAVNAKDFAVTNVSLKATKNLQITEKFSLPVFATIAANPSTQKAFFALGITLQP